MHLARCPFFLALFNTGSSSAAKMAMMAMTTSNSTRVNARLRCATAEFVVPALSSSLVVLIALAL